MATWSHRAYWTPQVYGNYRRYVQANAPRLKGRTQDCADLSIYLIVEFAAPNGLPLTFVDNANVRIISKGSITVSGCRCRVEVEAFQLEVGLLPGGDHAHQREGTVVVEYRRQYGGPEPGDLMLKGDHAALVYAVYQPGSRHARAQDTQVPVFPGAQQAAIQPTTQEYFRDADGQMVGPVTPVRRFDYLNHRGEGGKQAAELIYFAPVNDPGFSGFQFRKFNSLVLDN